MTLARLEHYLGAGDSNEAQQFWQLLNPADQEQAAALALELGRPAMAAAWGTGLTRAAAQLRLGQPAGAIASLAHQPKSARVAVLRARVAWQLEQLDAQAQAEAARNLARQEGDAGATIATTALLGEMQLSEPFLALRTLAEGLKVAELLGTEADAYLLAVLAHAQQRAGGQVKAERTAEKALTRSAPHSPARVVALLALDRPHEAQTEVESGELARVWLRPFLAANAQRE